MRWHGLCHDVIHLKSSSCMPAHMRDTYLCMEEAHKRASVNSKNAHLPPAT